MAQSSGEIQNRFEEEPRLTAVPDIESFEVPKDGSGLEFDPETLERSNARTCPNNAEPQTMIALLPAENQFMRVLVNGKSHPFRLSYDSQGSLSFNSQIMYFTLWHLIKVGKPFTRERLEQAFPDPTKKTNVYAAIVDMSTKGIISYDQPDGGGVREKPIRRLASRDWVIDFQPFTKVVDLRNASPEEIASFRRDQAGRNLGRKAIKGDTVSRSKAESNIEVLTESEAQTVIITEYLNGDLKEPPFNWSHVKNKAVIDLAIRKADQKGHIIPRRASRMRDWRAQL